MAKLLRPSRSLARTTINLGANQTQPGTPLGASASSDPRRHHTYEAELSEGAHLEAGFGHSDE